MPEMHFNVRWPDERIEACYSPSLVIKDHFVAGATYSLTEFRGRSRTALTIAAERVREKYGFLCSRALGQLARIEATAAQFEATPSASVTIVSFEE
ncbi:MSMEG_0570 family nitrogen starvation response protein [Bradyrhizobium sp. Ec3.3]|uniref:MSMEG_0570 family nitrogen starvation response protein n=1 Tax=Bradyrhizobium sp. Ec3.3 TaxID=189753 RepID=UPI0003FEB0C7|nr:MSMEG_0570 family nitrogen starvation response protein [Bradyrhizobium sp. Ec3.3]